MKRTIKLAINIGNLDREKYGLAEYSIDELTEGKTISVDEKTAVIFAKNGWVAAETKAAESPVVKKPAGFARVDER